MFEEIAHCLKNQVQTVPAQRKHRDYGSVFV